MAKCHGKRWALVVALVMCAPAARAEETLESVEKKIGDLWGRMESMSAKMDVALAGPGGGTTSKGTMEYLKKGDKELFRFDQQFQQVVGAEKLTIIELSVFDGEHFYTLQEFDGKRVAVKRNKDALQGRGGGKMMLDSLRANYTLKLGTDANVGGQDVWVIEAAPQGDARSAVNLMRLMVAKTTGIPLKVETVDKDGKVQMSVTYSDAKPGVKLDAERFTLKALGDVQVMDFTQGAQMSPPPTEPK